MNRRPAFAPARAALLFAALVLLATGAAAQYKGVTIGTGSITGVPYSVGNAICRLVNRDYAKHGVRCAVESTGGPVFNIHALGDGQFELVIASSDFVHRALKGMAPFKGGGAHDDLRSVMSLNAEPFTLVARKDANIAALADLRGRRIIAGSPGSGLRPALEELLGALGWQISDFSEVTEIRADQQGAALCEGRVDAILYGVAHPSLGIQDVTAHCGARLVSLAGPEIDRLVQERTHYALTTIPGALYPGNPQLTQTYGPVSTLLASAKIPEETVFVIVKAVFENLEDLRKLHPALARLKAEEMSRSALVAPLHAGAARYFRSKGWIP